jgi:hypothetical protein
MEEATELFDLQQQMLVRTREVAVAPPPPSPTRRAGPVTPAATTRPAGMVGEDALWETLPIIAAAAGVFAAIFKRAQGVPLPSRDAHREEPSSGSPPEGSTRTR